jgi:hypothetical protein
MIYMVEMALLETERRVEWEAWYVAHQHRLLSIPGIHASQRFECIDAAAAPFVALHEVDGPQVFTSAAYREQAGPSNTGEWQTKMGNWHRNVFRGLDHTPDVPMEARLVLVERGCEATMPRDADLRWLEAVGLDQSVRRRGLALLHPMQADMLAGTPGIRVLKPLGARLTPSSPSPADPAASR